MSENVLTVTATLGGRERKFCLTMLGLYKAVTKYGYGDEEMDLSDVMDAAEKRRSDAANGRIVIKPSQLIQTKLEDLWIASLPFEDVSLEDWLAEVPGNELNKVNDIWAELTLMQGNVPEEGEDVSLSDEDKKKREPQLSEST